MKCRCRDIHHHQLYYSKIKTALLSCFWGNWQHFGKRWMTFCVIDWLYSLKQHAHLPLLFSPFNRIRNNKSNPKYYAKTTHNYLPLKEYQILISSCSWLFALCPRFLNPCQLFALLLYYISLLKHSWTLFPFFFFTLIYKQSDFQY